MVKIINWNIKVVFCFFQLIETSNTKTTKTLINNTTEKKKKNLKRKWKEKKKKSKQKRLRSRIYSQPLVSVLSVLHFPPFLQPRLLVHYIHKTLTTTTINTSLSLSFSLSLSLPLMNDNSGDVVDHHHDHQNDDNDNNHSPTSSFSQKLHDSICNMSCCFGPSKHNHHQAISPVHVSRTRLLRTSSTWIKSRAHDPLPDIKYKCRTLISRFGRHRRRHSADFHYDALSYSRNFDQGDDESNHDEFHFRSFSSRLPPSPPLHEDEDEDEDEEPRSAPASSSSASTSKTTTEIISAYSWDV